MARQVNLENLTKEETKDLCRECMDFLQLEDVIELLKSYSKDDRAEIIAHLEE